jgi:hypothetical protein
MVILFNVFLLLFRFSRKCSMLLCLFKNTLYLYVCFVFLSVIDKLTVSDSRNIL